MEGKPIHGNDWHGVVVDRAGTECWESKDQGSYYCHQVLGDKSRVTQRGVTRVVFPAGAPAGNLLVVEQKNCFNKKVKSS